MIHTVVLFGASSSQAVRPDRLTPHELARNASKALLKDAVDLLAKAESAGAVKGSARQHLQDAQARVKADDFAGCVAALTEASRAGTAHHGMLEANLAAAMDFLVAANAADTAGVDARDAFEIYLAARGALAETPAALAPAWERLAAATQGAEQGCAERLQTILRVLEAPERALALGGN